jgi:hypothetical protein
VLCVDLGNGEDLDYMILFKAYSLGDKLLNIRFQDTVIDAIIEKGDSPAYNGVFYYPDGRNIEYAYNNTNEQSPLRKLLVDMYASDACGDWLRHHPTKANYPLLFVFELASNLLDRRGSSQLEIKATNYHIKESSDGTEGS